MDLSMKVTAGEFNGCAMSEKDFAIYKKRLSSNCFVLDNSRYDRVLKQIVPDDKCCVIDYHDGDYVNFFAEESL